MCVWIIFIICNLPKYLSVTYCGLNNIPVTIKRTEFDYAGSTVSNMLTTLFVPRTIPYEGVLLLIIALSVIISSKRSLAGAAGVEPKPSKPLNISLARVGDRTSNMPCKFHWLKRFMAPNACWNSKADSGLKPKSGAAHCLLPLK